jgi:GNAT superfamily N-acetyltransferase
VIEAELTPAYALRRTDDSRKVRALYNLQFPAGTWRGKKQVHWLLSSQLDPALGFCSAVYSEELKCAYFTAAWVKGAVRGGGIQRKMIRTRIRWARRVGAQFCITYCAVDNYASLYSLLRCGFKAYWKSGWHVCILKFSEIPPHVVGRAIRLIGE